MPLVSIVLTTYNPYIPFVRECIQSILNQSFMDLELVIIDDGSDEEVFTKIKNISDDCRICIKHIANKGISAARNIGIDMAKGEYITFVDCDDWLSLDAIEKMYHSAINNDVDMVQLANYEFYNGHMCIERLFDIDKIITSPFEISTLLIHKPPEKKGEKFSYPTRLHSAWGFLIRTKIMKKVKYGDVELGEDIEWASRAKDYIHSIYYLKEPLYYYRCSTNSISHSSNMLRYIKAINSIKAILESDTRLGESMNYLFGLLFFQQMSINIDTQTLIILYSYPALVNSLKAINYRHLKFGPAVCIFLFTKEHFRLAKICNYFYKTLLHALTNYIV